MKPLHLHNNCCEREEYMLITNTDVKSIVLSITMIRFYNDSHNYQYEIHFLLCSCQEKKCNACCEDLPMSNLVPRNG